MPFKPVALLFAALALFGQPRVPVVVELFTSEGCSSCPPADQLLAQIERTQPVPGAQVLVLSEHVDYWDRLGWRDPFSSPQFSRRQNEYSEAFRKDGVYTPQMVVNGRARFLGSDGRQAHSAIEQAAVRAKTTVMVTRDGAGLIIHVERIPDHSDADIYLALTEDGLRSQVISGENSGRMLEHTGVVRSLKVIGRTKSDTFSKQAALPGATTHIRAVVFVQDRHTREIFGAAALAL